MPAFNSRYKEIIILGIPVVALFLMAIVLCFAVSGVMLIIARDLFVGISLLAIGIVLFLYVIYYVSLGDRRPWVSYHYSSTKLIKSKMGDEIDEIF